MNKNNYQLKFSEQVQQAIVELVAKYNIGIDPNLDVFERIKREDPELIIFKAAKIMVEMKRETTIKNVIETLKNGLGIDQKRAEELTGDIKKNVPFWIEIEKPEENSENKKENFQKELLNKIRGSAPQLEPKIEPKPPTPYDKKPQIADVDKNATTILHTQQKKEVLPAEKVEEKKPVDVYREPAE